MKHRHAGSWLERRAEAHRPPPWLSARSEAPPAVIDGETTGGEDVEASIPPPVDPRDERMAQLETELAASEDARAALEAAYRTAVAERDAEVERLTEIVARSEAERAKDKEELFGDLEAKVAELAMAIARRAVGRELSIDPSLFVTWARDALAASDIDGATIALAPDVAANLPPDAWSESPAPVRVESALPPGTCEVKNDTTSIEVTADARLEAIAAHLGVAPVREAA